MQLHHRRERPWRRQCELYSSIHNVNGINRSLFASKALSIPYSNGSDSSFLRKC